MYNYKAFGFNIISDTPIVMLSETEFNEPDVVIRGANLDDLKELLIQGTYLKVEPGEIAFYIENTGVFKINNGNSIFYQIDEDVSKELLSVYLMGACMSAILDQHGFFPLHGSSLCKDKKAILLLGKSGAGKSTLASEFIKNGWKLLTDDIAAVYMQDDEFYVQPSYPSQKLWSDVIDTHTDKNIIKQSLYQYGQWEKYSINVSDSFETEPQKLEGIVSLRISNVCEVKEIKGINVIDQLMSNTFNKNLILPENKEKWFQQCVTISLKTKAFSAERVPNEDCSQRLYNMLCTELGGI